jgi:hypothetical protein
LDRSKSEELKGNSANGVNSSNWQDCIIQLQNIEERSTLSYQRASLIESQGEKSCRKHPAIVMPSVDEDKVIRAAAKAVQTLTPRQLAAMVPAAKVLRGRLTSDKKNR